MYGGVGVDERRAQRRQAFIDAGIEVIGSVGYASTTVRAVCAEAALTERYFYESFENLEALLCAVYEHLITGMKQRILLALQKCPPDPEILSKAALREYFEYNRDPHYSRIMLFEVLGVSPQVDRIYRRVMEEFAQLIASVSKPLYPGRSFKGLDEGLLTGGMVGAVVQMAMRWSLNGYKPDQEVVVDNAHAIFTAVNRQLLA